MAACPPFAPFFIFFTETIVAKSFEVDARQSRNWLKTAVRLVENRETVFMELHDNTMRNLKR